MPTLNYFSQQARRSVLRKWRKLSAMQQTWLVAGSLIAVLGLGSGLWALTNVTTDDRGQATGNLCRLESVGIGEQLDSNRIAIGSDEYEERCVPSTSAIEYVEFRVSNNCQQSSTTDLNNCLEEDQCYVVNPQLNNDVETKREQCLAAMLQRDERADNGGDPDTDGLTGCANGEVCRISCQSGETQNGPCTLGIGGASGQCCQPLIGSGQACPDGTYVSFSDCVDFVRSRGVPVDQLPSGGIDRYCPRESISTPYGVEGCFRPTLIEYESVTCCILRSSGGILQPTEEQLQRGVCDANPSAYVGQCRDVPFNCRFIKSESSCNLTRSCEFVDGACTPLSSAERGGGVIPQANDQNQATNIAQNQDDFGECASPNSVGRNFQNFQYYCEPSQDGWRELYCPAPGAPMVVLGECDPAVWVDPRVENVGTPTDPAAESAPQGEGDGNPADPLLGSSGQGAAEQLGQIPQATVVTPGRCLQPADLNNRVCDPEVHGNIHVFTCQNLDSNNETINYYKQFSKTCGDDFICGYNDNGQADCVPDLSNTTQTQPVEIGDRCTSNEECASGRCEGNYCVAADGGTQCDPDNDSCQFGCSPFNLCNFYPPAGQTAQPNSLADAAIPTEQPGGFRSILTTGWQTFSAALLGSSSSDSQPTVELTLPPVPEETVWQQFVNFVTELVRPIGLGGGNQAEEGLTSFTCYRRENCDYPFLVEAENRSQASSLCYVPTDQVADTNDDEQMSAAEGVCRTSASTLGGIGSMTATGRVPDPNDSQDANYFTCDELNKILCSDVNPSGIYRCIDPNGSLSSIELYQSCSDGFVCGVMTNNGQVGCVSDPQSRQTAMNGQSFGVACTTTSDIGNTACVNDGNEPGYYKCQQDDGGTLQVVVETCRSSSDDSELVCQNRAPNQTECLTLPRLNSVALPGSVCTREWAQNDGRPNNTCEVLVPLPGE